MNHEPRRIVYHGEVWVERVKGSQTFQSPRGTQLSETNLREMKNEEVRERARARRRR